VSGYLHDPMCPATEGGRPTEWCKS
jgi:hypothetical protein